MTQARQCMRRLSVAALLLAASATAYPAAAPASDAPAPAEAALIDPDCEPERAQAADPALVEEPDGVCPPPPEPAGGDPAPAPDETPSEPAEPEPQVAETPATPGEAPAPAPKRAAAVDELTEADDGRGDGPARERKARRKKRQRGERSARARTERRAAPRTRSRSHSRRTSPAPAQSSPHSSAVSFGGAQPRTPLFLLPIYRAAAARYGIQWEILAAINEIETDYGRNLNVSSAGAVGWMQFMPATWRAYGTDADNDGRKDPYDPMDAIFAAARYLKAAGYANDVRRALFAYNHADWYVESVLLRARLIAAADLSLPDPLPRARRLDRRFAAELVRTARRAGIDWQLALAVLRARGHDGRVPATRRELRALVRRLVALGARKHPLRAIRRLVGARPFTSELELGAVSKHATFAEQVVALVEYHRAVGLRGLVRGLEAVRERLARRALRSRHLEIYGSGRADIERGVTDVRVLVLLLYLAGRYEDVGVTSLTSGHSFLTASGNVSAHSYGRAVDIASLNGKPILGHQQPGGLTERALWRIMLLPEELQPKELISLFELGGPSFALADHADHIHVGY